LERPYRKTGRPEKYTAWEISKKRIRIRREDQAFLLSSDVDLLLALSCHTTLSPTYN
jgi:hypothetical protein